MSNKQTFIPEKLKSLAPVNNAENVDVYLAALKKGVDDKTIFNIALSGPYGSGKSSILKTFAKQTKHKCIEISLATFKVSTANDDKNASNNNISEDKMRLIELSILQQIIYATNKEKIPLSGFKRTTNIDDSLTLSLTFRLIVGLVGILYFMRPKFISLPSDVLTLIRNWQLPIFPFAVGCILLAIIPLFQWLIKMFLLSRVSAKVNLSVAELGLEKDNLSILNKHIDEIIYIFESVDYTVVLIEDLDRFNDNEIFTKLREINNLINIALSNKKESRKVTFIYAVKDDMFADGERTKFFELIIPVIPVVDTSNSYDIALKEHKVANISDELLSYVMLYINEKRLLDNIFNEYYLYRDIHTETLNGIEDKLFAMIVYKNKYPADFAKLHKREGIVYSALNSVKNKIVEQKIELLHKKIEQLNAELVNIEKNRDLTSQNFKLQFIGALVTLENPTEIVVAGESIPLAGLTIENLRMLSEKNEKTIETKRSVYEHSGYHRLKPSSVAVSNIERLVTPGSTISDQLKYLDGQYERKSNEINNNIRIINLEIDATNTLSLSALLTDYQIPVDLHSALTSEPLLMFLLREGYINEMYTTVTSRFYPESLTLEERDFIMDVKNLNYPKFDVQLQNFNKVFERLNVSDFSKSAILNNCLVDYLLENQHQFRNFKETLFNQLSDRNQHSDNFISQYFDNGKNQSKFVIYFCYRWRSFWTYIQTNSLYSNERKLTILRTILLEVSSEHILSQNLDGILSEYIGNQAEFCGLFNQVEHFEKISEIVRILGVKFKTINEVYANGEWFDFICDNNLYELNPTMVNLVLRRKSKARLTDTLLSEANFTCVLNSEYQNLKSYVGDNIDTYVKWVLLADASQQKEETGSLVILLANNAISSQEKAEIIRKQKNRIIEIGQFSEDCWTMLYEEDKVAPIWSNVLKYYDHIRGIDDALTSYLNRQDTFNELAKLPVEFSKAEVISSFTKDFISPNKISNESFEKLLVHFEIDGKWIFDLATQNMVKITALIRHKKLPLTPWVFEQLKTSHSPSHQHVIKQNLSLYFSNPDQYKLEINDYLWLLEANDINDYDKGKIASIIPVEMIQRSRLLGEAIFEMLTETNAQNFPPQALLAVFLSLIEWTKKIKCLGFAKYQFNQDTIFELLRQLDSKFIIPDRNDEGQIIIDNTEENKNITDELKMNEIIDSVRTTKHLIKFKIRDN